MSCAFRSPCTARSCSCVLPAERLRRLWAVRMLRPGVDLELGDLLPREAVPRQHALDCLAQDLLRPPLELLAERSAPEPARIAGVPVVALLIELVARHPDLLRVHHDDEVARVDMRGVGGLALAPERVR